MATPIPAASGTLDFGRCFTYLTEDPEWLKKVLIGGAFALLMTLLVGIPFVLGYCGRTLKNVARGELRPLPEWDDLGGLFGEGLTLAAVYLLHALAAMVVIGALFAAAFVPMMAAGGLGNGHGSEALAALGGLAFVAVYGVVLLLSLALYVYLPAALVRTTVHGTVAAGFDWRRNVAFIRANLGNYLLSLVVFLLVQFLSQVGMLLCCIGLFWTAFAGYLVAAAAFGQTVRLNPDSV
jgi:hypothetical protein